jgi:Uma2 family endonuclease
MQERIQPPSDGFTFEQFVALVADRPDHERWELIEGVIELNPTPVDFHQMIVSNVMFELTTIQRKFETAWMVRPGLGINLPSDKRNAPAPDVLVRPFPLSGTSYCADPLVVFEVLSPSTRRKDLTSKRAYYTKLGTLQHYVVIEPSKALVRHFAREAHWKEQALKQPLDVLALAGLDVQLSLSDIYRGTGVIPGRSPV